MKTSSSQTLTSSEVRNSLEIIEVKPGLKFSKAALQHLLPDVETALFFGKVYELDHVQLSHLLGTVLNSTLANALFNEGADHSTDLQDYVLDLVDFVPDIEEGDIEFDPHVPKGEILPELWKSLEIEVADSIKKVAEKLQDVVNQMPGKQGEMLFRSMSVLNAKRPTIGDHRAVIHHARQKPNLVIMDDSASMSETTVHTIVEDVVALSYMANAYFARVSNTCTFWEPGTYGVDDVLAASEFGGTHYEQLAPLFDRDWGVVVTIADYDSSPAARGALAQRKGRVDEVLDISLVNRPTFLAEVIGQLATEVRPLLVAAQGSRLCSGW